jgi:hypothetical protein
VTFQIGKGQADMIGVMEIRRLNRATFKTRDKGVVSHDMGSLPCSIQYSLDYDSHKLGDTNKFRKGCIYAGFTNLLLKLKIKNLPVGPQRLTGNGQETSLWQPLEN